MTIRKCISLVICLSLILSFVPQGYLHAEDDLQSTEVKAKKLELRRALVRAKEHGSPKPVTPPNKMRVENLAALLKNVQTSLKTQGSRSVKVWKFINKKLVLKDAFQVTINPGGENLGLKASVDSSYAPTIFDAAALSEWLTPFLSDSQVFDKMANVFPVKVSSVNKQINTEGLKKYFILPKVDLPNVRSIEVWNDTMGYPVMFGLNTVQKGYLLYDFDGRVTSAVQ